MHDTAFEAQFPVLPRPNGSKIPTLPHASYNLLPERFQSIVNANEQAQSCGAELDLALRHGDTKYAYLFNQQFRWGSVHFIPVRPDSPAVPDHDHLAVIASKLTHGDHVLHYHVLVASNLVTQGRLYVPNNHAFSSQYRSSLRDKIDDDDKRAAEGDEDTQPDPGLSQSWTKSAD